MIYENEPPRPLPYGIVHLVYRSDDFDADVARAREGGASLIREVATLSTGFGERRVAFFRSPSGCIFEIIEILRNLVPELQKGIDAIPGQCLCMFFDRPGYAHSAHGALWKLVGKNPG